MRVLRVTGMQAVSDRVRKSFLRLLASFFFIASLLVAPSALAAEPNPRVAFAHVLPDQIASIGYINSIAQDAQGFMWFGGASGLARYDGYKLTLFLHEDGVATSLSHNYVNHIEIGRDGSVWVATRAGINLFDSRTRQFTHFSITSEASDNDVTDIHEDRRNRWWLATRGGIFSFDRSTGKAERLHDNSVQATAESSQIAWAVADDLDGNIWFSYQSFGVSRYDPGTRQFENFARDANVLNAHGFNDTRRLYVDGEGRLYAGTYGDGLYQFDKASGSFIKIDHDDSEKGATVWSMLEDRQGNLWVGDGSHVHMRPANTSVFYRYAYNELDPASPGNYVVNIIFEDRAGDIWLGYFPSGIDMVDRQASVFQNFSHSSTNSNSLTDGGVSCALEDHLGNLWVGTGYGLNYFDRAKNQFTRYVHDPANPQSLGGSTVLSMIKDDQRNLWLGLWSAGLNSFDQKSGQFTRYLPTVENGMRGREVWSLVQDKQKNIWLATEEGLNKFDPVKNTFEFYLPPKDMLGGDKLLYSRVVYLDKFNNLWLGTLRGLFLFDRNAKTFKRFAHKAQDPTSLSADFVLSIYEDRQGNLWVGTDGGGLNKFDRKTEKFTSYTIKSGLGDNVVSGMVEDPQANLWVGTQKGISQMDADKFSFHNYEKHDGLADNLYNRNAALRTQNGELFFGNSKGFTLFKTDKLSLNPYAPNIVITDLQLGNKSVPIGDENSVLSKAIEATASIQLSHRDTVVALEFSALSFHHVEDNQYAYRLRGFEEEWNYVGTKHFATYTNLNPGTYVFEVKGSNNDGVWSTYPASLQIIITPPWWKTWWAYSLYAALFIGVLWWFMHVYKLKLSYQAEKLERERVIVKRLTQIDKLKDEFLANTSHELRTPLNGIIGLADSLRDGVAGEVSPKMKYHLSLIADSGRRLASLVNDILDFSQLKNKGLSLHKKSLDLNVLVDVVLTLSKPLLNSKKVVFLNNVPKDLPSIYADEDRVLQILHNLIGNAVKFTDRGVISVGASLQNDMVQVDVSDTGTGIPADRINDIFESFMQLDGGAERVQGGAGLGLSVTKQLVELHGGVIRVDSVLGVGSTFYFTLPTSYGLPEHSGKSEQALREAAKKESLEDDAQDPHSPDTRKAHSASGIMIVDDDSINRKVISNYLAMSGYRVFEADCADKAIAMLNSDLPVDLVLLDIMMPRVSGYEACKILRQSYKPHELPIILLTARAQVNDLVLGFEAGANDFLVKPVAKETLLARVATHLQLHDVTRNLDQKVAERTEELNRSNAVLKHAQQELEAAYRKLEEASLSDPLTGLNNRRFLNKSIAADIAIAERSYGDWLKTQKKGELAVAFPREQDLVFMLLDIDFFKTVNDTYGHSAGDKLLEQLSDLLRSTLRESDYLIRWGGEEFLIVVRFCNREEVPELAERIRQKVANYVFDLGHGQKTHRTCSIGMAAYPFYSSAPTALTWEQVIDTADRALYLAKHSGRNCWFNVQASTNVNDYVNPAVSDSLISLAAAGVVQIASSND